MPTNAWGEDIAPDDPTDPNWVPPSQRLDFDFGPESDALDDETGDDLDGWTPADGKPE